MCRIAPFHAVGWLLAAMDRMCHAARARRARKSRNSRNHGNGSRAGRRRPTCGAGGSAQELLAYAVWRGGVGRLFA